jgi:tetratricopeptide (TPR) repeat protein
MVPRKITLPSAARSTSRALAAAAIAIGMLACAEPDAVTSPAAAIVHAAVDPMACTVAQGQQLIDAGQYQAAIPKFTCVIGLDPTGVEGYRGRIEAQLMLGRFSDAMRDYGRVSAFVEPVHPDVAQVIIAGYQARLAATPASVTALTGLSFAHWWNFDYQGAIRVLDELTAIEPNGVFGNTFRGSSRLLKGTRRAEGVLDLERAIALAPSSPDVRWVVADAYTYGYQPDAQRAFAEATQALNGGLNTPRIRAILAASYFAFGQVTDAAGQIAIHIDMVTTELVGTSPLAANSTASLPLVPGRTYEVPIVVSAGETVDIMTSSRDFWDSILVLLAADGTPVLGSDDYQLYHAGFKWVAPAGGTYRLRVTSFEGVNTGTLLLARK